MHDVATACQSAVLASGVKRSKGILSAVAVWHAQVVYGQWTANQDVLDRSNDRRRRLADGPGSTSRKYGSGSEQG